MKLTTKILVGVIGLMILVIGYFSINMNRYKNESLRQSNNIKYYQSKYSEYVTKSGLNVYKTNSLFQSINELKESRDSLDSVLVSRIKELKIKESKIQSLQHYIYLTESTNSGYFSDTIFRKLTDTLIVELDTLKTAYLTSDWVDNIITYNPKTNKVDVKTISRDELIIVGYIKRETITPRKKFFLLRWFQKRQNIYYIEVVNSNPNCKIKYSKVINTQKYDSE
jgi:hypothetical protein